MRSELKIKPGRTANLVQSFLVFWVGLFIGLGGLVVSFHVPPSWVLGSKRVAEFSSHANLANAAQGLAAIGALVVGVPASIGASIATIYLAHRAAKAAEQVEHIEKSRDRRELLRRLRERANNLLQPYNNVAQSFRSLEAASRDLIALFIHSAPKLYRIDPEAWDYQSASLVPHRKFVVHNPTRNKISLSLPPEIQQGVERLLAEIHSFLRTVSLIISDFGESGGEISPASRLAQAFGIGLATKILAFNDQTACTLGMINRFKTHSDFASWADLAATISSQTFRESLIFKLDALLIPFIFAPETMRPSRDVDLYSAVEGEVLPVWISRLGVQHAVDTWQSSKTTIIGGLFWIDWEQPTSFYDLTEDQKVSAVKEELARMEREYYESPFDDTDGEAPEGFDQLSTEENRIDLISSIETAWNSYQAVSGSTSRGSTLGAELLQAIACLLPSQATVREVLRSEATQLTKVYRHFDLADESVDDLLAAAIIDVDDPSLVSAVRTWKIQSAKSIAINVDYGLPSTTTEAL